MLNSLSPLLPQRSRGTLLPAVLAAALLLGALIQLVGSPAAEPISPAPPLRPRIGANDSLTIRSIGIPDEISARPLFAPRIAPGDAAADNQAAALGGVTLAGTVSLRGRRYAVIRKPDGGFANLGVGAVVAGWKLLRLGPESAGFSNGSERIEVPYGGAAAPVSDGAEEGSGE